MKIINFFIVVFFWSGIAQAEVPSEITWQEGKETKRAYWIANKVVDFQKRKAVVSKRPNRRSKTSASEFLPTQSPVFSASPSGGSLMALPGGAVVTFPTARSFADAQSWAQRHGTQLDPSLSPSEDRKIWLMKTAPGLESVEVSNRLNAADGVVSSSPNWWVQVGPKVSPSVPGAHALRRAWHMGR